MSAPSGMFFLALYLIISTPVQLYLFGELRRYLEKRVGDVKRRRKLTLISACFFIVMLLPPAWRALIGLLYGDQPSFDGSYRTLLLVSTTWWVGSIGCAILLSAYNLFRGLILFSSGKRAGVSPDLGKRDFLRKGFGMTVAAPFLISGYGVVLERRRFELEHFDIPVRDLSGSLSELTIAQLTDIHVGPFMPPEELAEYVEAVNRLQPDLIALTGDFVTGSQSEVVPCVETLARLRARYGVFACIGNHDIYAHAAGRLTRLFAEKGIHTLRNDAATLRAGNSKISVLGIDDLRSGHPDLKRALTAAQKNPGEVKILLSHRPEVFPIAAEDGIDLVLSGHYHGGQIRLRPAPESLSIARFLTPYAEGLFQLRRRVEGGDKTSTLFVGRGVGISGLPVRINCPPQIAHLTLKKA